MQMQEIKKSLRTQALEFILKYVKLYLQGSGGKPALLCYSFS